MALVAEVWGTKDGNLEGGDCEIREDICKVQACNCDRKYLGRGIDQGRGEGKGACSMSIGEPDRHVGFWQPTDGFGV
jgi:hypothetical protein